MSAHDPRLDGGRAALIAQLDEEESDLRAAYRTTERAIAALLVAREAEGIAKAALGDACADIERLRAENERLRDRIERQTVEIAHVKPWRVPQ